MALTKIPRGLLDTGIADSSDATAITIDSSENVTFAGNLTFGDSHTIGDDGDDNLAIASSGGENIIIDSAYDIYLDADNGAVYFRDGGTTHGFISTGNNNFGMTSSISDDDIVFTGNDGGSSITALRLDMSAAGAATFNSGVTLSGDLSIAYGGGNITWGTNYPAIGNIKNSQATLVGNNIKAGSANNTIVRHAHGTDAGNFIALTYNKGVTFHTGITTTQNSDVAETTNERVRIDTSGKVNIGATSFTGASPLVGATWSTAEYVMQLENSAAAGSSHGLRILAGGNSSDAVFSIRDRTNSNQLLFVTGEGKVGIGGSSPKQALHIFGDSGDARMQFTNSNSGNADADGLWVGMDNSQAYILQRENLPVSIYTNATKVYEFTNNGNFVGKTAGATLQILGSSSHTWAIGVDDNSTTPGTASTSFSVSRYNGSDWKNPFRISTEGVVQLRGLSTDAEPQVSGGEILAVNGPQAYGYEARYVQGIWGPKQASNAQQYTHLVTDMWGGGSPHGNTEYIMGGFFITGYRYATNANLHDVIQFHNWNGSMYNYTRDELGSWTGATYAYVNSSGWVTLRLYLGGNNSYRCFTVDFVQYGNLYSKRTAKVTAETQSANATI